MVNLAAFAIVSFLLIAFADTSRGLPLAGSTGLASKVDQALNQLDHLTADTVKLVEAYTNPLIDQLGPKAKPAEVANLIGTKLDVASAYWLLSRRVGPLKDHVVDSSSKLVGTKPAQVGLLIGQYLRQPCNEYLNQMRFSVEQLQEHLGTVDGKGYPEDLIGTDKLNKVHRLLASYAVCDRALAFDSDWLIDALVDTARDSTWVDANVVRE